jgi:hypothetical protein
MTKYLAFFLKYYPNCVSILYKKRCRVVLLAKRTFFTIVFFANVLDFVLWPRVTFFPIFANVQCHIIKNLLTPTVRAVRENIQPRSCCIDLAIARSIQQDLGWIFSRTARTVEVSKLLIERLRYPGSGLRVRVSPLCLPIFADVSVFTRNFYPFPRGKPWSTRKRQTGVGVFCLLFVGRLNSKNFQHLTQINNAHMLVKVFNNQWRTSTAKVTILWSVFSLRNSWIS